MVNYSEGGGRVRPVKIVSSALLQDTDGTPVVAVSEYTTPPTDGRPLRPVSTEAAIAAEGGPVTPIALYTAGTLATPDGRPVGAVIFTDGAGIPFYSGYPLALDYKNGRYRDALKYTTSLTTITGYGYSGHAGVATAENLDGSLTTFAAGLPRITNKGYTQEEARTQLLVNPPAPATQTVTVTAVAHTLSFVGTGSVTLSGTSTAGPLVGTGASNRVSLTFTPTAGSLTLTISGDVRLANLSAGAFPTSYMPVTGVRATDALTVSTNISGDFTLESQVILNAFDTAAQCLVEISDGTSANRVRIQRSASGNLQAQVVIGGVTTNSGVTGKSGARIVKAMLVRSGTTYLLYGDGVLVSTLPGLPGMPTLTNLTEGYSAITNVPLNGVKILTTVQHRALSAAEAIAATS